MNPRLSSEYRDVKDYRFVEALSKDSGGVLFTHSVNIVADKENNAIYYQKLTTNPLATAVEATAGQLIHLLMPYQPQTLLAKNDTGQTFILSKEIMGYEALEDIFLDQNRINGLRADLNQNKISGFGSVLTMAYFLNETDAKLGNMGIATVNGEKKIIKIDNDWCLAAMQDSKRFGVPSNLNALSPLITEEGIASLPLVSGYKAYNWLDFMGKGQVNANYMRHTSTNLIESSLSNDPGFRKEVNETLLKILLLPIDLINNMVSRNTVSDDHYQQITRELIDRRNQVQNAALQNTSFYEFMQTPAAKEVCAELIETIKQSGLQAGDSQESMRNTFEILKFDSALMARVLSMGEVTLGSREATKAYKALSDKALEGLEFYTKLNIPDKIEEMNGILAETKERLVENENQNNINVKYQLLMQEKTDYYLRPLSIEQAMAAAQKIVTRAQELQELTQDTYGDKFQNIIEEFVQIKNDLMQRNHEQQKNRPNMR